MSDWSLRAGGLPGWLSEAGPELDVVLSTRHRVARNLRGCLFPSRASDTQRIEIAAIIRQCLIVWQARGDAVEIESTRLSRLEKQRLLQARMVSPLWCEAAPGTSLWLISDRATSVMVNEEDHIRVQSIQPGLQVQSARNATQRLVGALAPRCAFARDSWGRFVTSSLANYGSGARTSALLHLPALRRSRAWKPNLELVVIAGATVRGAFGEGTGALGDLIQVSVRGVPDDLSRVVRNLVHAERQARCEATTGTAARGTRAAVDEARHWILERETGIDEALQHVSALRLGVLAGWIDCDLVACSRWIADAGAGFEYVSQVTKTERVYEWVRSRAALRSQLRVAVESGGTRARGDRYLESNRPV